MSAPDWASRFSCARCGRTPDLVDLTQRVCPVCDGPLTFEPPADARPDDGLGGPWRYRELVPASHRHELDPGEVPRVVRSPDLESLTGAERVWLVDLTRLGTGTFKDLEAQVLLSVAADLGWGALSVHSTGNTARAFHHWASRADLTCTVSVPRTNLDKLRGLHATARQRILAFDGDPLAADRAARDHAASVGTFHLAPLEWKMEGAATIAYALAEQCPDADLIVQTVGSGLGPLGYELGFGRAATVDAFCAAPVVSRHGYLLVQPSDTDALARAIRSADRPCVAGKLAHPAHPYEPTLLSTNVLRTAALVRRLPGLSMLTLDPEDVERCRDRTAAALDAAGVVVDPDRERSGVIALAGLCTAVDTVARRRVVVLVTGAAPLSDHSEVVLAG